jgi:parvulin-like peptidyl-prolyl isomerase
MLAHKTPKHLNYLYYLYFMLIIPQKSYFITTFTRLCYNLTIKKGLIGMRKSILFLILFSIVSYAKPLNAIAMSVNGMAITTAEIKAVERLYKVSNKKAIDMLIMDRVQQSALKDIPVDDSEVNDRILIIAEQNGITVDKMKKVLTSQGTKWQKYKDRIKMAIKKEKFFRQKIAPNMNPPSNTTLKRYYEKNKKTLLLPTTINVIEYSTKDKETIDNFLKTKSKKGIKSKKTKLYTKKLDESMLNLLMRTQNGAYTRPMNAGDRYIIYKVLSKSGKRVMSFNEAKPLLIGMYQRDQRSKKLKEYFTQQKLKAKIKKLR